MKRLAKSLLIARIKAREKVKPHTWGSKGSSWGKVRKADGGGVRKPGETYNTQLSPLDEMAYRQWVAQNKVPTNPDATGQQDYDMRGFYQGLQQQNPKAQSAIDPNDTQMHYPDYWKTPSHETFSNESQWATPNAPSWTDDDKLVAQNGRVIFDDRNRPSQAEQLLTVPAKADGGPVDDKPAFDPSQPFQAVAPPADAKPAFDPSKPFEAAPGKSAPSWSDAITDVPHEIASEAGSAIDKIKALGDRADQGPLEGLMTTGKAVAAIPQLIASPLTGAARSLIGHPMAQAEHAVGTVINPEVAAKDDPAKMYEAAKGDVDLAMSAARPAGAPVKVGGAYEWQAPPSAPNLKPVGVAKQPETDDFFEAANNHYANMRGMGVEIDPKAMNNVADNIMTELHAEGYRPRNAPKVFDAVDELRNPAGQNHEISDIDSVRKVLGKARMDPSERDAARRAIGHIDDYLADLGNNPQDVVVNPHFAARVGEEAQAARANYAVAKRSEDIDDALDQAERQAGRSGAGHNINNAIRQRLSALRNNKKKMVGWTDDEKAELDTVINGTATANAARQAGKFAPHGIVSSTLSMAAGHAIAPGLGTVAVPATGLVARMLGDRMTRLAAERLQNVVKARSPLGRQTSINAAAQSALANPQAPKRLASAVRVGMPSPAAQIPYRGVNLGPMQGAVPAGADNEQQ